MISSNETHIPAGIEAVPILRESFLLAVAYEWHGGITTEPLIENVEDRSLKDMLLAGDIDALFLPVRCSLSLMEESAAAPGPIAPVGAR